MSFLLEANMKLLRGIASLHPAWWPWLVLMVTLNLVMPLIFISHTEAQATLFFMMVSGVIAIAVVGALGFVRLVGLMHIGWFILIPYLAFRIGEAEGLFYGWMLATLIVNSICLVIDVVDVGRYLAGEREDRLAT
ncbi:MAG: hypothetical protein AAFX99_02185 [Myxococcota bacterium]